MKVTATKKITEHFQINFEVHLLIFSPFDLQVKCRIEMFIIFILFCFYWTHKICIMKLGAGFTSLFVYDFYDLIYI